MADKARRWLEQGMAAIQAGDRARAEPLLLEAARLDPNDPEVWLWLGWAAATPQEALERIGWAVTLAPQDPNVQKAYAWAQDRLAEVPRPAPPPEPADSRPPLDTVPDELSEDVPLEPGAAFEQGCALLDQGASAQAVPFLEAAVQEDPSHADFHAQLAVAYYHTDRLDEAIDQFQRAIELRPKFAEAYYSLGLVHAELGQEGEAIGAWQRCLNLDPRHTEARRDLGALTKKREERLFEEIRQVKEPPPAGVSPRDKAPAVATQVVREPVRRSPLPYIIAALWGLWTAASGLQLAVVLLLAFAMPDLLAEMQRRAYLVSAQEAQMLWMALYVILFITALLTLGGIVFVVANIRRWPWVFYGNIAAAVLFILLGMCNMTATTLSNAPTVSVQGSAGGVSGGLAGVALQGFCTLVPPIIVIALSFLARDDFRRQTITVVAEGERLPTGDAADYYNRGLRRSKRGRLDQAVVDWETAVRLKPGDVAFRNVLALGYAEQKRFAQAIEQLEAALQIAPHDRMTLENMRIVRDLQTGRE